MEPEDTVPTAGLTVIVTEELADPTEFVALRVRTYTPGCPNTALVLALVGFTNCAATGPDVDVHWMLWMLFPVTVPFRLTAVCGMVIA